MSADEAEVSIIRATVVEVAEEIRSVHAIAALNDCACRLRRFEDKLKRSRRKLLVPLNRQEVICFLSGLTDSCELNGSLASVERSKLAKKLGVLAKRAGMDTDFLISQEVYTIVNWRK